MDDIDQTSISFKKQLDGFASQGRSALLPALHAAQDFYGYITPDLARQISRALYVPLADVYGVIEFYSMLYSEPVGRTIIRICSDPVCAMYGSDQILSAICEQLRVNPGETNSEASITLERVTCLGLCEHAPAALVNQTALGDISADQIENLYIGHGMPPVSRLGGEPRLLTANCGKGRATTLAEYLSGGGYSGLQRALRISPGQVIEEIKESGLMGRGGAAFSTGAKWESAARASDGLKYIVCNADESEPGTFKDRVLLEEDPQRIIEGMIIAAYAVGSNQGYIYVRGEYPHAFQVLTEAVSAARQAGYLGSDIYGTGFSFEIELRLGAGAYIGGEETALFESIEGKRGFPRLKPPFPTTHGLFGKPTVINNVETICNVPFILSHGAAHYRQLGTARSSGTKLFCLSGDIARPGLFEAPFGVTLHQLLAMAGGVRPGQQLQTILLGGAAGIFTQPHHLDLPLTFEDLRAAGLSLGSGVIMVIDNTRDLRDILMRLGRFFAHESCGKCYPCQIGTQRQYEILQRIFRGETIPGDSQRLADVGWTMTDASICGLGQTAASAVLSALKIWPELFAPVRP